MLVAAIALLGVLITACIQWWVGRRTSAALNGSAEAAKANAEAARASAEAAGRSAQAAQDAVGVNAQSAAAVAKRAEADALAKRYHDAAEQLGHGQGPVRLAGVYAMARLADDWLDQRQTCVDVLCAYLRMSWPSEAGGSNSEDRSDEKVRDTILSVISDHLRGSELIPSWRTLQFDFSGATFRGFRLYMVTFQSVPNFSRTRFLGNNLFEWCSFEKGAAFDHSRIEGTLTFDGAFVSSDMTVTASGLRPSLRFDYARVLEGGSLTFAPQVITKDAKILANYLQIDGDLHIARQRTEPPSGNYLFEGFRLTSTARFRIEDRISASWPPSEEVFPAISILGFQMAQGAEMLLNGEPVEVGEAHWRLPGDI